MAGIFRCVVRITNPALGGNGSNTWHVRVGELALTNEGVINNMMGEVEAFYTAIAAQFGNGTNVSFNGEATEVGVEDPEFVEADTWSVGVGGGSDVLPPANALVVGWRAASGGRSGRGRTFLGPLSDALLAADGTPEDVDLASIRDAASALVDASEAFNDGALVIWSPTDNLGRDFTGSAVRDLFAVLRSRRD